MAFKENLVYQRTKAGLSQKRACGQAVRNSADDRSTGNRLKGSQCEYADAACRGFRLYRKRSCLRE